MNFSPLALLERRKKCPVCAKPSTFRCSKCKMVFYCGAEHQKTDWFEPKNAHSLAHKDVCHELKHAHELFETPTPDAVAAKQLCAFVPATRECLGNKFTGWNDYFDWYRPHINEVLTKHSPKEGGDESGSNGADGAGAGDDAREGGKKKSKGKGLYRRCGCVATIARQMTRFASYGMTAAAVAVKLNIDRTGPVTMHVIGASDHAEGGDPLTHFIEFAAVLRPKLARVVLIGPELKRDSSAYAFEGLGLKISHVPSLYHDAASKADFEFPDFAIAYNAGLHAADANRGLDGGDWEPTVRLLRRHGVPLVITEYDKREATASAAWLQSNCTTVPIPSGDETASGSRDSRDSSSLLFFGPEANPFASLKVQPAFDVANAVYADNGWWLCLGRGEAGVGDGTEGGAVAGAT